MDFVANNNPPAEVVYDSFPDDWITFVETLPLCVKCSQNHQHLPGATRCIECLGNRPGPLRKRAMYRIVHEGGIYCSTCYIREAPELGFSCPRCANSRAANKLQRKLNVLLAAVMRRLEMVNNAVESAGNANSLLVAIEHAMKAVTMIPIVYDILQTAQEILDDMAELDAAKADAVTPNMLSIVELYRDVRGWAKDTFVSAASAWLEQGNLSQAFLQALSNIDDFLPSTPLQQDAQNHSIQHGDNSSQAPALHHNDGHAMQNENYDAAQQNDSIAKWNLQSAASQVHSEDQLHPANLFHDDIPDDAVPELMSQHPDQNPQHGDNLLMHGDNIAPPIAPSETNDNDEPDPDDILFNP
ncbi:uncharacterized protein B0T23DRAFT_428188 [Neurospora hispaniola]|uniref:Uncharacterized protein n=1 Tax=Neurospora hispaniola TaxID=588809 RepID=A0AAJ0IB15_9PEZI|nr:hypothetical protein B0T23DRAFT_428188 [Neurospora hispaniola]